VTLLICPVRPGDNNEELRFALRSWETNLVPSEWLRLMVVGDKPDWLLPDEFVPGNRQGSANANIFDNVMLGADAAVVGGNDEAIYMNDDFFCLDPVPGVLPVRRNMTLAQHIDLYPQYRGMWWVRSLDLTASWLSGQGFPSPWSYEVHRPLICKPADMLSALSKWDGGLEGDIPQWRTLYGTINEVEAYPVQDVKANSPGSTSHSAWFSTSDSSWNKHARHITPRFQKPSRWER
jgi:hypothetical protein